MEIDSGPCHLVVFVLDPDGNQSATDALWRAGQRPNAVDHDAAVADSPGGEAPPSSARYAHSEKWVSDVPATTCDTVGAMTVVRTVLFPVRSSSSKVTMMARSPAR